MTFYYVETSSLFKRYGAEDGSEFMDDLFAGKRYDEDFLGSCST